MEKRGIVTKADFYTAHSELLEQVKSTQEFSLVTLNMLYTRDGNVEASVSTHASAKHLMLTISNMDNIVEYLSNSIIAALESVPQEKGN